DLEASLLELDVKQGEMYVGGLVGYESAVRSVSGSISEKNQRGEASGIWSSFVDGLEQSERSSLLCSLTSLAAIRAPADEEDEVEVTRVTSVSEAVLGMRRIQARPAGRRSKGHAVAEPADQSFSGGRFVLGEAASKKLADIQFLEEEDEEDESPTRVVVRPNYLSVSLTSSDGHSTVNALQAVLAMDAGPASVPDHRARVLAAEVTEQTYVLGRDVLYPEEEMPEETALDLPPVVPAPGVVPVSGKGALGETKPQPERRQSKLSRVQVLSVLTLLVVILILAIMVALRFVSA
ncbi:MAG: hypothetical protein FWC40_07455, partial [Proteobacteria bacterium]|nr:hypothetical protein [Pseudomonadota bacterium]